MVKGKDSSCLRINCEGINAIKRGQKAVSSLLVEISNRSLPLPTSRIAVQGGEMEDQSDNSISTDGDPDTLVDHLSIKDKARLDNIASILQKQSKYEICKACLSPCLGNDNELEDAKHACSKGSCLSCGFDKVLVQIS